MLNLQMIGNLGADAVIRETNGKKSISFNVAENQKFKNQKGEQIEKTTWASCTIWRNADQSTEVAKYLLKGTKVFIEGKPEVKLWNDERNNPNVGLNVTVSRVELLSTKDGQNIDAKEED